MNTLYILINIEFTTLRIKAINKIDTIYTYT